MRDYGKVYTAFWTSEDTRAMSEDGRMLALYLLTCDHGNMLGCFRIPDAYAAEDLKWTPERVSKGFAELLANGFAYRCDRTFWVVIRQYLKWNQFENPNVGTAAGKLFDTLSAPISVKALLVKALREFSHRFPTVKLDKFEAENEPSPNPFETLSKTVVVAVAVTGAVTTANPVVEEKPTDQVKTIFAYWQKVMASPKSALDAKRTSLILKALKHYSPADICKAIRGCTKSPHHMGVNDQKTKYNGLGLILRNAEYIDKFIELDGGQALRQNETVEQSVARLTAELESMDVLNPAMMDSTTIDMESA